MSMILSPSQAKKQASKIKTATEKLEQLDNEFSRLRVDANGTLIGRDMVEISDALFKSLDNARQALKDMESLAKGLEGLYK